MDINDPILTYSGFVDDRINTGLFRLDEVPSLHPASARFREFWRPEKQNIIQGKTIGGVFMPPKLYFYTNYATIYRNLKGAKAKLPARPTIRDIEWMVHYNFLEARGFSGFRDDPEFSCNLYLTDPTLTDDMLREFCLDEEGKLNVDLYDNLFKIDGTRKEYENPRYYLRKIHKGDFNLPLFFNEAKNLMMFGSRGFGKSYLSANLIAHEWLVDGASAYNDFTRKNPNAVEVIVGAEDAKYSSDTLNKVKLTIEKLPGGYKAGDITYPSPLFKNFSGSWKPGYEIVAKYKKKEGGRWEMKGSGSMIKNRTFKDNPFAVQGTRPGLMVLEEIGMFNNLEEVYGATVENQRDGRNKFGTTVFIGTGGDFEGGGTRDAYKMFYNPESYDILPFEDVWEAKPKIGFFMPAYMGLNQFKNANGFTDILAAKNYLEEHRFKLQKQPGAAETLRQELQYRPIKPSEMFLAKSGNIFPVAELKQRLETLEANPHHDLLEKKVKLLFDSRKKYGVAYQIDTNNELIAVNDFPWGADKSREGAVIIYEFPRTNKDGIIPKDLYIIGHDPIASDATTGESLSVTVVMKTKEHWLDHGHDEIVAIYAARPYLGREVINDNLLKLSMMYGNAKIFFENNVGNTKEFFEKVARLDLLAKAPQTIFSKKASFIGAPTNDYGYSMANRQKKLDGLLYIKDWLLEERGRTSEDNVSKQEGRVLRNLDRIWDKALLKELIAFNLDGNFDRVMALMGCVFGLYEMFNQYKATLENASGGDENSIIDLDFLTDRKKLSKLDLSWNTLI